MSYLTFWQGERFIYHGTVVLTLVIPLSVLLLEIYAEISILLILSVKCLKICYAHQTLISDKWNGLTVCR